MTKRTERVEILRQAREAGLSREETARLAETGWHIVHIVTDSREFGVDERAMATELASSPETRNKKKP